MDKYMWVMFAALAGLSWGTYVPFVQQGIAGLQRNALASFLCVGVAYFLIAVLYPVGMFATVERMPTWNAYGITMATLAGVAGAVGALCVILANRAVAHAYPPAQYPGVAASYRVYIAPIIFALAPLLNTLISTVWHPTPELGAFHFGFQSPGWKLWLGVLLIGGGAALVLYSKEESEHTHPRPAAPAVSAEKGS